MVTRGARRVAPEGRGVVIASHPTYPEGLECARSRAETRAERQAVKVAGMVLAEEVSQLGITHAGFAMTSLPA
jgi:hypothetical protein